MECKQSSIAKAAAPRKSRFPARDCLRKGCRCRFTPTSGRQRYCQDPDCLREVRRWHASRRQRVRRQRLEVRKAEAVDTCDALGEEARKFHLELRRQPVKTMTHLRRILNLVHLYGRRDVVAAITQANQWLTFDAAYVETTPCWKCCHRW